MIQVGEALAADAALNDDVEGIDIEAQFSRETLSTINPLDETDHFEIGTATFTDSPLYGLDMVRHFFLNVWRIRPVPPCFPLLV